MANTLEKIKNLKKVKGFDADEFDGVKSKIAEIVLTEVETRKAGNGNEFESQNLIIKSANLGSDEKNPIVALEYISLKRDKETGEFGIPENTNSNAMKFLRYFKAESFDQVIGKEIMIVKRSKPTGEFLGIHYG